MRDRQQLETLLLRRFPGSSREQVAAAANAIMALTEQWNVPLPGRASGDDETAGRSLATAGRAFDR
jgi:hypothetical protein